MNENTKTNGAPQQPAPVLQGGTPQPFDQLQAEIRFIIGNLTIENIALKAEVMRLQGELAKRT